MELRLMTEGEIRQWYDHELTEAFPPTERKPLSEILNLLRRDCYEPLGLFDGDGLLGYAMIAKNPKSTYVLMDYLGVTALRRNGGLGAEIIRRLGARYAGRAGILAEADVPVPEAGAQENDLRRRRIAFYERCGFVPLYHMAGCGMCLQALLLGGDPADLEQIMGAHRAIYGAQRTDIQIPLSPGEAPQPPHWMEDTDEL